MPLRSSVITFLGTGAGDFYEDHQRDCQGELCTRARRLDGRNLRHAPSLQLAPDVVIDLADAAQFERHGADPTALRHVLITHGHYDHFGPAEILRLSCCLPQPLTVYGSSVLRYALDFAASHRYDAATGRFLPHRQEGNVRFRPVEPGQSFEIGDSGVTPLPANHMICKPYGVLEQPCLSYLLRRGGRTLFYGLDSSWLLPETVEVLARVRPDVLVLDATFGELAIDPTASGHLNFVMLDQTLRDLRDAGALADHAIVIASHISTHEVPPHDEIAPRLHEKGIVLAYDGMTIDL